MDDNLFSSKEAAGILGVGERQIRRKAAKGQLTRIEVDGKVYYKIPAGTRPDVQTDTPGPARTDDQDTAVPQPVNEVQTPTEIQLRDQYQIQKVMADRLIKDVDHEREQLQQERQERQAEKRSRRIMDIALCSVTIALGIIVCLGIGSYQGRAGELGGMKMSLSAVSNTAEREKARADRAEANLTQAQKDARALAAEKERLQKERDQALDDLADQINRPAPEKPVSWLSSFLESAEK